MHGIRRDRGGGVRVGLTEQERELVRQLCERLAAELESGDDDDGLARLFPAAYPDDKALFTVTFLYNERIR